MNRLKNLQLRNNIKTIVRKSGRNNCLIENKKFKKEILRFKKSFIMKS
jgi:hypothetical protein